MRNIVILDIETTGADHLLDEICQMSYIVVNRDFDVIKSKNFFFMVDYVHFKSNKKKLNIEELKVLSDNKTFKDRYEEILDDLNGNLIVCHKCEHDISFLKSEFMRVNNKNNFVYEEFCTMKYYTNILKIPSENFGYKYPKLSEIMPYLNIKRGDIHNKSKELFNLQDNEINFHDSRVDVVATYLVSSKTDELINVHERYLNNVDCTKVDKNENREFKLENNKQLDEQLEESSKEINSENTKSSNLKNIILSELFSFKGTLNRKKFSIYMPILIMMYVVGIFVIRELYLNTNMYEDTYELFIAAWTIVKSYILIALVIKRLRDLGRSLWLTLLLLIGIINIFFIIDLCISKGNEEELNKDFISENKGYNKRKLSKPMMILIGGFTVIGIIVSGLWIWVNWDSANENEAIEIVKNTVVYLDLDSEEDITIDTYINQKIEELDPNYIDGWYASKIEKNIYLVSFDFDMYDDDYENGYSSYPYEVNLETKEILKVSTESMITKYENLGYFDDEIYINQFKEEIE